MATSASEYNSANAIQSDRQPSQSPRFAGSQMEPVDDLVEYVKAYARQNPGTAALWCFGVGFIIGWKLKPW